ncbi:FAD-binding oxidoreductase [Paraburkholderia phosphatilytica]|uniref:FAD-binding oxidoreductase n=1 Tax=Paraburkholderia phosphatilytica TaxID=2282883 RepID=UPI000E4DA259|nr:FAD-binding oxidoreductase [Paraburkholderia phosphatilytica]
MSTDPFMDALQQIVGPHGLVADSADRERFERDWRGNYPGRARAVVRPASTGEVAAVVRLCSEHHVPVVPQGGNTGLAGGSSPDDSGLEVVLSLTRMNRVRSISLADETIMVEAGCILQHVQEEAARHNRLFPLSLAAEGTATIGGNLSSNAGGEQVLRYGNARDLTLGLEVVLPDGRVWNGLSPLRKDNTGYDLKHLFIGGEGTLGVITAASLKLFPLPRHQCTAWLGLDTPRQAIDVLMLLRETLGDCVTSFELVGRATLDQVLARIDGTRAPLAEATPWSVLVEVSETARDTRLDARFEAALGDLLERGFVRDAVVAQSSEQAHALWHIRDHVPEAQRRDGPSIKHDLSVPISRIPEFIETTGAALAATFPGIRVICFGHVGDGNLHYNQSKPAHQSDAEFRAQIPRVHDIVHEQVARMHGSISAEHGIGRLKQDALMHYKSAVALDLMARVKRAIDPDNLFNPGRLLPAEAHHQGDIR